MIPRFTTQIPTRGPAGNIFVIVGTAMRLMRQIGLPNAEIEALRDRVNSAPDYDAACDVVREYFPLEDDVA